MILVKMLQFSLSNKTTRRLLILLLLNADLLSWKYSRLVVNEGWKFSMLCVNDKMQQ